MTPRTLATTCILALLISSCTTQKTTPLKVDTTQHSPVRLHLFEPLDPTYINQVLLLPPLGIKDPDLRDRIQRTLYSAAQRRFTVPIRMVSADSAYSPYVGRDNLIRNDGTFNLEEIAIIGNLMNTIYVICPHIRELKPYHPQLIDIQILIVDAANAKVCAELSGVFDARDNDTFDNFISYGTSHKKKDATEDDMAFQIQSPAAFQGFVADASFSVMAEQLPF